MKLSVRDYARPLNVPEKTKCRRIEQQSMPAYRVQDQSQFNRDEILEWATAAMASEIIEEPVGAGQPVPLLVEALEVSGIHCRVSGFDTESPLNEIVQLLRLPAKVDVDLLVQISPPREAIVLAAVGDGIAIPYVPKPVVLQIDRPAIALGLPDRPLESHALNGLPLHTVFIIISPTARAHLRWTSKLLFVLPDRDVPGVLEGHARRQALRAKIWGCEARLSGRGAVEPARDRPWTLRSIPFPSTGEATRRVASPLKARAPGRPSRA